jgi:hypothetical protein
MRYDTQTDEWVTARYPMKEVNTDASLWMGISEITLLDDDAAMLVVERDKGVGGSAEIKRIYRVDVTGMIEDAELDKTLVKDLRQNADMLQEKVEGMTVFGGDVWVVNDNDGAGWTRLINVGTP